MLFKHKFRFPIAKRNVLCYCENERLNIETFLLSRVEKLFYGGAENKFALCIVFLRKNEPIEIYKRYFI